jgi:3-deoxy-D-manno-octulosonic-acid transferase
MLGSSTTTKTNELDVTSKDRPAGEVVWCHAADASHAEIALRLADRLTQESPDIHLLLTTAQKTAPPQRLSVSARYAELPAETNGSARSFLDHWAPDVCVWTAGDIRPVLLSNAGRRDIPLFLVDAIDTRLSGLGWRWLPNGHRTAFKLFEKIMARDHATEEVLRVKLGVPGMRISVGGPLWQGSRPLRCNEEEREELSKLLLGRPVWLGAHLHRDEITQVLDAHLEIIRVSHRTVLVLSPNAFEDVEFARQCLENSGLRFIDWSAGEAPDETTQAILTDDPGDLGLWYRVAPITFMGSSLAAGTYGSDPNEPAAHGSAILYGPNVRQYLETYSRFAEVGAARIVRDAETLAHAVQRIIPADQSAAMAHAAWDVATQSAAVMDQIVDMILEALERRSKI